MSQAEVFADLKTFDGSKSRLMQHYSDEMKKILDQNGGSPSDMPLNADSPYHKLQHKLTILGQMRG